MRGVLSKGRVKELESVNNFRIRCNLPELLNNRQGKHCLKCDKLFLSEGNWNRICDSCKSKNHD